MREGEFIESAIANTFIVEILKFCWLMHFILLLCLNSYYRKEIIEISEFEDDFFSLFLCQIVKLK